MNLYLDLFLTFARIGGLTFGGGYAMYPMLLKEVVENKHWDTEEHLAEYYALGQCTPGVIAVNTATFVGTRIKGWKGALAATLGVVFPSLVIITVIAAFLKGFADNLYVQQAFAGIRVVVTVLVVNTVIKLLKGGVFKKGLPTLLLYLGILIISCVSSISPVWLVLAALVLGFFLFLPQEKSGKEDKA